MEEPSGKGEITGELSGREKEVLKELASGKTNKEIADRLSISVNTVITHRKNISSKLGIKSVSGLSLYALMNGVI
ncbi:MAG: response regulator transcription factor [Bacteroidales bacterium]|nr:response regulator transcription factor [Bacteroidales bacterium]